jgi:hypothetical protein
MFTHNKLHNEKLKSIKWYAENFKQKIVRGLSDFTSVGAVRVTSTSVLKG